MLRLREKVGLPSFEQTGIDFKNYLERWVAKRSVAVIQGVTQWPLMASVSELMTNPIHINSAQNPAWSENANNFIKVSGLHRYMF